MASKSIECKQRQQSRRDVFHASHHDCLPLSRLISQNLFPAFRASVYPLAHKSTRVMHSILARINNTSALLSSCMMTLLAAIALSTFVFTAVPDGNLNIASVQVYVAGNYNGGLGCGWLMRDVCIDSRGIPGGMQRRGRTWRMWTSISTLVSVVRAKGCMGEGLKEMQTSHRCSIGIPSKSLSTCKQNITQHKG